MWGGLNSQRDLDSLAEFSKGPRFSRATMFFRKRVVSVSPLLLIINITMYILISLL